MTGNASNRRNALKTSVVLAVLALASANAAQAQEAPPSETGKDAASNSGEIVVTANKRGAESMQDIAASVQAIGEETISRDAKVGFDDYARDASNLTALNKGPGQTQIAFRGVVSARVSFGQPQAQSTTGMYVDDVPITDAAYTPDLGLVDINRVEILRGPQGTLYGSSAMSGAIRIMPNLPNLDRFEGSAGGLVSNTRNGDWNYQVYGALNVPIGDTLAVRGVAFRNYQGGYVDNVYSGEDDYNDAGSYGGRFMATFKPSDSFSLTGMFIYNKLKAHGRPDEYIPGDPDIVQTEFFSGVITPIIANQESPRQFAVTRDLQTVKPVKELFEDELKIYSLKAEYDFGSFNATVVGSRLDRTLATILDDNQRVRGIFGPNHLVTGEPVLASLSSNVREKRNTLEARLASGAGSRIKWVVGGYYEDFRKDFELSAPIRDLDSMLAAIGGLPPGESSSSFYQTPVDNVLFYGLDDSRGNQKSVFGEITLPIPFIAQDKLSLTLGGRYYNYDLTASKASSGFVIGPVPTGSTFTIKEDGFNPKVALEFKANEDFLLYGSVSKGFRTGGTNEALPGPSTNIGAQCIAELASLGLSGQTDTYGSDSLTNYEVGAKTSWLDRKLNVNAALFYIDWKNIQTNVFLKCGFSIKANETSQISKGAEFEINARVTDSLTLNLNASYTNAELAKDSQTLAARKGDRAPYVPEWNIGGGFQYRRPAEFVGPNAEFYLNGDVSYLSEAFSEYSVSPSVRRLKVPSSVIGNLAVGIDTGRVSIGVFAKNLWDERIVTSIDTDRNQPATYTRARPRTVGVNLSVDF